MKNTVKVHSFHGGIHPPENKKQSTGAAISAAPVPSRIVLPLQQHIGLPADPLVKVGDRVLKGQQVAEAIGRISANIHASTSGTVTAIESHPVPHMSGMTADCIIIEADGKDEWIEHSGLDDYTSLPKPELIEFIRQQGVAGMGGAGFPTDVKLHLGDDHIVNTLIINAAECEPYITADDMLMRERADQIMGGIEIIAHLLKPLHIMVGIEDNKPQAIRALHEALDDSPLNLDIVITPTKYPSGGEKQLIKLLTGVEVPSGRIPADVGIVCQNVGTTTAIFKAVTYGEPLISRIVTVTGQAAGHRQNYEVRIGTRFADLLDHAQASREHIHRLVVGGPMMGITVTDEQIPVIKTTNCLIAGSVEEMPPQPPAQACIRCGMCEQVCPVELLPQQLHWFAKGREFDKARHHNLFDCIECGACSYVCPSNIPLVQYYRFAKAEIRKEDDEQRKADHARIRFEARQERLEREKIEKEERRKQRAIDAAKAQAAKKDAALTKKPAAAAAASTAAPDLKQLKQNAAIARTKLGKAEKALTNAQSKGQDGIEALQATVQQLQVKFDTAQKAYEKAQSAPAPVSTSTAPVTDLKQLKQNAAIARTKLKKAEKQLEKSEANGDDADTIATLQKQISELQAKNIAAEKAFKDAEAGDAKQPSAPIQIDTSELEADIAAMQAKVDKGEAAWKKAAEAGSPAADKMAAGVEKLKDKLKALQDELAQIRVQSSNTAAPAPVDTSDLEADIAAMQAKVDKGEAAWKKAVESGSPAADKMAAGVEKLKDKLKGLQDELAQIQSNNASAPAQVDTSELEADIAAMQAKVDKGEAAWKKAAEAGSPAADKMAAGVEKLKDKLKGLQDELAQIQSNNASASAQVDTSELEADIAAMQAKVDKGEAAWKKAAESGSPAADKMAAGVNKLKDKLKALQDELVQTKGNDTATAETAIVETEIAEIAKPDIKELKQQVSIMRTKLKKAEKQLSEADDSEDTSELAAEIEQLKQRHDEAKATLDKAEAEKIAAAAQEGIDLKQLKIDAALARAAVTKVERALSKAEQDSKDSLEAELISAKAQAEQLNSTLERFSE
ncbi:electron transport complex subunit RsxC [Amphritea balenae]|uniref:Ion-translocating oxidoreductase complex subunit C n=1 Tax=Amphritea balenae TaxID=452629 RepID=A0A3P1ST17_9GAMM|nr:electron transport complex subunit RsxC [Amphritea balenae]RRD00035.1 electron transport complex subunit RsxC [Amphritea balenae]GGK76011.1 electron transport complex subunit C [Amphritea balenae]